MQGQQQIRDPRWSQLSGELLQDWDGQSGTVVAAALQWDSPGRWGSAQAACLSAHLLSWEGCVLPGCCRSCFRMGLHVTA